MTTIDQTLYLDLVTQDPPSWLLSQELERVNQEIERTNREIARIIMCRRVLPARPLGNSTTSGYGEMLAPYYYTVPGSQGIMSAQMDSTFPPVSASPLTTTRLAEPPLKRLRSRLRCRECRRNKIRCLHPPSTWTSQDSYLTRARAKLMGVTPLLAVATQSAAQTKQVNNPTSYQFRQEFSDPSHDYSHSSLGYSVGLEPKSGVGPIGPQCTQRFGFVREQGPTILPVVSPLLPKSHVHPHHSSHNIPHQPLTTPKETPVNQFHDRIDIPPHASYPTPTDCFQHTAATPQHNTLSPDCAFFPPEHYYNSIPTNSPTESIISSSSAIPTPPLFGQTEGASVLKSKGDSDWLYDPTISHTFQGGLSTGPTLDYFDVGPIPVTEVVPHALFPAHRGELASLRPRSLVHSHGSITPEPSVSVELSAYRNYPVAPVEISGIPVVPQRREVAVWITLDLSSVPTQDAMPWSAVRIARTPSVHVHREDPAGANVLGVDVVVSGAETHKEYIEACHHCKERRGAGPMIDYRSKADLVKVTKGMARLHFVFCCYPADRDEEKYYRVDVVLSERLMDGQRRVVVRKQLPYHFDVYSRHMADRASDLEEVGVALTQTT